MKALFLSVALATLALPALAHEGLVHDGCDPGAEIVAGHLTIAGAFTRATLPNARTAGGYFVVSNSGAAPDRLVSGTTEAAQRLEFHSMEIAGDMMKMAEIEGGIEVLAGASVALEPGGLHVMLMGLGAPLVEGECVALTLTFEKAGEVPVTLFVADPAAAAAPGHTGH